ncbi:MAG: S1C family serine protease [Patescibacteria group bacterium]
MKRALLLIGLIILVIATAQRFISIPEDLGSRLENFLQQGEQDPQRQEEQPFQVEENRPTDLTDYEDRIISVINDSLPSVVTIGIQATARGRGSIEFDPTNPFGPFRRIPGEEQEIDRNIGSGFIITKDGLIISNKHVVDFEDAEYTVLTNDGKEYQVEKIYRDPLNDLAILKINANNLPALPLADSSKLEIGQTAIAIGTPLGEFNNTVTTGIVSGLGRGITAGSPYEGFVEKLDNVIQTDASISPGNSGGPLLNSNGQVIGVNTAVSAAGENIGFAIPSNVVSDLIDTFNRRGGSFERPFIGVRYRIVDEQTAVLNDIVQGAYIIEVIEGSPAEDAGLEAEDIIMTFDGNRIEGDDTTGLAEIILEKNIGDTVPMTVWRDGEVLDLSITLGSDQ